MKIDDDGVSSSTASSSAVPAIVDGGSSQHAILKVRFSSLLVCHISYLFFSSPFESFLPGPR